MDKDTFDRKAYSWGGRFHLAYEVDSEFGKSLKTLCGQLHNPATIKAQVKWGQVPNALLCRECLAHEGDKPEPTQVEGLKPDMWPDLEQIVKDANAWENEHPVSMAVFKGAEL